MLNHTKRVDVPLTPTRVPLIPIWLSIGVRGTVAIHNNSYVAWLKKVASHSEKVHYVSFSKRSLSENIAKNALQGNFSSNGSFQYHTSANNIQFVDRQKYFFSTKVDLSSIFFQNLISPQNIILQQEEKTSLFFVLMYFLLIIEYYVGNTV